jgi:hypothetical protein
MTSTTTEKQIEDWKTELASAMADGQWRRALQLCSWLRYALEEQDGSDPAVEQMQVQAKEALAEQIAQERAARAREKEQRRLRVVAMNQIASGTWMQALDSTDLFYQNGASPEETLDLLQQFRTRLSGRVLPTSWQKAPNAEALAQRFNELLDRVRGSV